MGHSWKLASPLRISRGRRTEGQQEVPLQSLLGPPNTQKTYPTSNSKRLLRYSDLQIQTWCKYSEMLWMDWSFKGQEYSGIPEAGKCQDSGETGKEPAALMKMLTRPGHSQKDGRRCRCGLTETCHWLARGARHRAGGWVSSQITDWQNLTNRICQDPTSAFLLLQSFLSKQQLFWAAVRRAE